MRAPPPPQKPLYRVINYNSLEYPRLLKEIADPPPSIYVCGEWPDWNEGLNIAIVGARKATRFGLDIVPRILEELAAAERKVRIVSGLAFGIDAETHRSALYFGLSTWGVLGSGIDVLYPKKNAGLAEAMLDTGGYLTEFPVGTQPRPGHFPRRNRVISGLCHAVVLVEGTVQSGSLITAKLALEQGREVFVVRPPNDHVMYGANWKLIEEGASIFESGSQILEEVRFLRDVGKPAATLQRPTTPVLAEGEEVLILASLKQRKNIDSLIRETKKSLSDLSLLLTQMEIKGLVRREVGGFWSSTK